MEKITQTSSSLAEQLANSLNQKSEAGKAAKTIGNKLDEIEDKLIAAYKTGDTSTGKIKELEIEYQRAQRAMTGFMELMRSMHEMLMSGIRNLRLN